MDDLNVGYLADRLQEVGMVGVVSARAIDEGCFHIVVMKANQAKGLAFLTKEVPDWAWDAFDLGEDKILLLGEAA